MGWRMQGCLYTKPSQPLLLVTKRVSVSYCGDQYRYADTGWLAFCLWLIEVFPSVNCAFISFDHFSVVSFNLFLLICRSYLCVHMLTFLHYICGKYFPNCGSSFHFPYDIIQSIFPIFNASEFNNLFFIACAYCVLFKKFFPTLR